MIKSGLSVGMILETTFPHDVRVGREGKALVDAGYDVRLLCRRGEGQSFTEEIDGIKVRRFDWNTSCLHGRLCSLIHALFFINPVWYRKIQSFIKESSTDILHVHDLCLLYTAVRAAIGKDVRIVADLHEDFPAMLQLEKHRFPFYARWLFSYGKWLRHERKVLGLVDRIIVVSSEFRRLLAGRCGIPSKDIVIVQNKAVDSLFSGIRPNDRIAELLRGKFVFVYVGGLGFGRGLEYAVRGISLLGKEIPKVHLLVVGGGPEAYVKRLKDIIDQEKSQESVTLLGRKNPEEILPYYLNGHVHVLPYDRDEQMDLALSNKLFESIQARVPLLVSSCPAMKRIVEERNIGLVFDAGNVQSFIQQARRFVVDTSFYRECLDSVDKAANSGFASWKTQIPFLLDAYKGLR